LKKDNINMGRLVRTELIRISWFPHDSNLPIQLLIFFKSIFDRFPLPLC
jgi:hypothetical protein